MKLSIAGAGMAGLLAGLMFRKSAQIMEAAKSLPNNHNALLRFRSDEIGKYLNIPFKEVQVIKAAYPWRNPVADALAYSGKATGKFAVRSSTTANGEVEKRYIAPPDFISSMEHHQSNPIMYDTKLDIDYVRMCKEVDQPIISTLPMPVLMRLLGYENDVKFLSSKGIIIKAKLPIETDFCATIYYPDPTFLPYRASMTGSDLIIEFATHKTDVLDELWLKLQDGAWVAEVIFNRIYADFGLDSFLGESKIDYGIFKQEYVKILPIDDKERRKFILWATDNFGIYSVGRFAVWKPGLLLDDVFTDIKKVQSYLTAGHNYEGRK